MIILSIVLGIVLVLIALWLFLYFTIGATRPYSISKEKRESMKDYDSYEEWVKDWR